MSESKKYSDMRKMAEDLWKLLDDISTALDMFKPEIQGFEKAVIVLCRERHKYFSSDGYKLYMTSNNL